MYLYINKALMAGITAFIVIFCFAVGFFVGEMNKNPVPADNADNTVFSEKETVIFTVSEPVPVYIEKIVTVSEASAETKQITETADSKEPESEAETETMAERKPAKKKKEKAAATEAVIQIQPETKEEIPVQNSENLIEDFPG